MQATAESRIHRSQRRANAAVEVGVVLALVVLCIAGAAGSLGRATRAALGQVHDQSAPAKTERLSDVQESSAENVDAFRPTTAEQSTPGIAAVFAIAVLVIVRRRRQQRACRPILVTPQVDDSIRESRLFAKRQQIYRILSNDPMQLLEGRMAVKQLMSLPARIVTPATPMEELRRQLQDQEMRHLLVCDEQSRLVGVISNRDFAKSGRCAADIMSSQPSCVTPDTMVSPAVTALIDQRISCLPVLENGRLCGVLTTTDVAMAFQCALQFMAATSTDVAREAAAPADEDPIVEASC